MYVVTGSKCVGSYNVNLHRSCLSFHMLLEIFSEITILMIKLKACSEETLFGRILYIVACWPKVDSSFVHFFYVCSPPDNFNSTLDTLESMIIHEGELRRVVRSVLINIHN